MPEDPFLSSALFQYFPEVLQQRFPRIMDEHRLRREIIVTHIANEMVNRGGSTFAFRLNELTGASYAHIARAYTVAVEVFGLRKLGAEIEALDNQVADAVQKSMLSDVTGLIERATAWLLGHRGEAMNISETVDYFAAGVAELVTSYPRSMAASNRLQQKKRSQRLLSAGVPKELAQRVAYLVALSSALDIVEVANETGERVDHAAAVYYGLGDRLSLHWLREQVSHLPVRNHWQAMAGFSLRNDLHEQQKLLTRLVLTSPSNKHGRRALGHWLDANAATCERFSQLINDFKAAREIDFAMLSVAISQAKSIQAHAA
ncbi:MAG: NAD-glutamate dehydrogenase [Gammaproteobacteria bacterium]|nr:NAD-glutamate dehydrogenase [Gammaproteobacteria bacterium]